MSESFVARLKRDKYENNRIYWKSADDGRVFCRRAGQWYLCNADYEMVKPVKADLTDSKSGNYLIGTIVID